MMVTMVVMMMVVYDHYNLRLRRIGYGKAGE
jgi:hypothetical protein